MPSIERQNIDFADKLGSHPTHDLGCRTWAEAIPVIMDFQKQEKIQVDGILGPVTYGRLLARTFGHAQLTGDLALDRGRWAVNRAKAEFVSDVVDPQNADPGLDRHRRRIEEFALIGSGDRIRYVKDGDHSWCLDLTNYCYAQVGLRAEVRHVFTQSTHRLDCLARGEPFAGIAPPAERPLCLRIDPDRPPSIGEVLPGDIAVMGDGKPDYGEHGEIVEHYLGEGVFRCIGGNTFGPGPRGNDREGVCRQLRYGTASGIVGAPRRMRVLRVYRYPDSYFV